MFSRNDGIEKATSLITCTINVPPVSLEHVSLLYVLLCDCEYVCVMQLIASVICFVTLKLGENKICTWCHTVLWTGVQSKSFHHSVLRADVNTIAKGQSGIICVGLLCGNIL